MCTRGITLFWSEFGAIWQTGNKTWRIKQSLSIDPPQSMYMRGIWHVVNVCDSNVSDLGVRSATPSRRAFSHACRHHLAYEAGDDPQNTPERCLSGGHHRHLPCSAGPTSAAGCLPDPSITCSSHACTHSFRDHFHIGFLSPLNGSHFIGII